MKELQPKEDSREISKRSYNLISTLKETLPSIPEFGQSAGIAALNLEDSRKGLVFTIGSDEYCVKYWGMSGREEFQLTKNRESHAVISTRFTNEKVEKDFLPGGKLIFEKGSTKTPEGLDSQKVIAEEFGVLFSPSLQPEHALL